MGENNRNEEPTLEELMEGDNCKILESLVRRKTDEPTLQELMEWDSEGYCEATDGCIVEPDGTCEHGCESWLLELGMI